MKMLIEVFTLLQMYLGIHPVFYFELFHNFGFPTQKCSLPEIQSLLEKRKERKVVLRINWNVPYKFVEQIMHKVVSAGKESILLQNFDEDYDPNHRKTFAVDLIIPNAGMNVGTSLRWNLSQ